MDQSQLNKEEELIKGSYRKFLSQVKEGFNRHCDEVKAEAVRRFNAIPESDKEGRQRILAEQKAELDKTLGELKQLLNTKGAEVRKQLEEIAVERDRQDFDLDRQLEDVLGEEKEGHAV